MASASAYTTTLRSGVVMPLVGVGMYKVKGQDNIFNILDTAFGAGYRSIDTATGYRNEELISNALSVLLPKYDLCRGDLFITSKLAPKDQGYQSCIDAVHLSLKKLSTDYLDLYLIHWPGTQGLAPGDIQNAALRRESWKGLEQLYAEKKLRNIGVSNYTVRHLTEMLSYASIMPHVLQVEYHPHFVQRDLFTFCEEHGIHLQAYASLGTTTTSSPLISDPIVLDIARKMGRTVPQILLRWAVQQGIGVLPKSLNKEHIEENILLDFKISDSDMELLSNRDVFRKYAWDPTCVT